MSIPYRTNVRREDSGVNSKTQRRLFDAEANFEKEGGQK